MHYAIQFFNTLFSCSTSVFALTVDSVKYYRRSLLLTKLQNCRSSHNIKLVLVKYTVNLPGTFGQKRAGIGQLLGLMSSFGPNEHGCHGINGNELDLLVNDYIQRDLNIVVA